MQALLQFPIPPPERPGELACRLSPHAIKNFWYPGICHNTFLRLLLNIFFRDLHWPWLLFPWLIFCRGGNIRTDCIHLIYTFIHLIYSLIHLIYKAIYTLCAPMSTYIHLIYTYVHLLYSHIHLIYTHIHLIYTHIAGIVHHFFFFLNAVTDKLLITTRCVMVGCVKWG